MLEKYKKFFSNDRFAAANGIEIMECNPGYARVAVNIEERHLNGANVVHGGLYFTIADFAVAVATNIYGLITLTCNADISYFKGCENGIITAEAVEIARSNKLSTCEVSIRDSDDQLLAKCRITSYITLKEVDF